LYTYWNDLFAVVRRDVEVDVRHGAAVLGEEPLEEELVLDRIDLGDVEHVRDDRVSRGPAALGRDPALLAEANDVPVDEEELREAAAVDDAQLMRELHPNARRHEPVLITRALLTERVEEREGRL
jgi:hypothetical protein